MEEELERNIAARNHLIDTLERVVSTAYMEKIAAEVEAILNPPPTYETVEEIVGWVNVYQKPEGSGYYISSTHPNKESADASSKCHGFSRRISCQPIKVTVQRPKPQPVERSATFHVRWEKVGGYTVPMQTTADLTKKITSLDGKTGTLVFTED